MTSLLLHMHEVNNTRIKQMLKRRKPGGNRKNVEMQQAWRNTEEGDEGEHGGRGGGGTGERQGQRNHIYFAGVGVLKGRNRANHSVDVRGGAGRQGQ